MQERQWRQHKYIRKEGNRYIYPEDLKKTPKQRKLMGSVTDINGNRVPVRGRAATKTIANRSGHYDQASGERMSPQEYRQKQNRAAAANGVRYINNFDDGTQYREYSKSRQEFAKKQGQWAKENLRKNKLTKLRRKASVLNQGTVNRQQESKEWKEYKDFERADQKKRDAANKQRKAVNNQGKFNQESAKKQGQFSKNMMKKEKEHDAYNQIQRGTSAQEAAKKQGNYSKSMMRKEKTRRSSTKGADFVNRRLNRR